MPSLELLWVHHPSMSPCTTTNHCHTNRSLPHSYIATIDTICHHYEEIQKSIYVSMCRTQETRRPTRLIRSCHHSIPDTQSRLQTVPAVFFPFFPTIIHHASLATICKTNQDLQNIYTRIDWNEQARSRNLQRSKFISKPETLFRIANIADRKDALEFLHSCTISLV